MRRGDAAGPPRPRPGREAKRGKPERPRAAAAAIAILCVASAGLIRAEGPSSRPAPPASRPADNLAYWLSQAKPSESRPADANAAPPGTSPLAKDRQDNFRRQDALPGAVQFSDGTVQAGYLYTTAEKDWLVWVEAEKRWRRIPFPAVLSITAVVIEEKMEPVWRWKEMGVPERVYTGQEYPTKRLEWAFRLIDGSTITGTVKGQPLWIEQEGGRLGPFVLHETVRGADGQKLQDLVTLQRLVVSGRYGKQESGTGSR